MPTAEQARDWYAGDGADPVHGFDHVMRVLRLAEDIGRQVGADMEIVRAAVLLHDARGAAPGGDGGRATHEQASAAFARSSYTSRSNRSRSSSASGQSTVIF